MVSVKSYGGHGLFTCRPCSQHAAPKPSRLYHSFCCKDWNDSDNRHVSIAKNQLEMFVNLMNWILDCVFVTSMGICLDTQLEQSSGPITMPLLATFELRWPIKPLQH
jgi:hypothetical protein